MTTQNMDKSTNIIAWAKWLNTMDWAYYCTFTTRYSMSVKSAGKSMERLHNCLKKKFPDTILFWVAEPFDAKDGCHVHALLKVNKNESKAIKSTISLIKKSWQVVSNGRGGKEYNYSVILDYDKNKGGNHYVSKYMNSKNAEYDFIY